MINKKGEIIFSSNIFKL